MLEFNNNHIVTGYIKQLLADFNLPKYKVYTKEQKEYFEKYGKELNVVESIPINLEDIGHKAFERKDYDENLRYIPYIKDDQIQIYVDILGQKQWINKNNKAFFYNSSDKNNTKKFIIKNNLYDSYTHRYLGDYLRFQRDYNNVDLMPLYNCFSNEVANHLKINLETNDWYFERLANEEEFKANTSYKLIIPLNQTFKGIVDPVTIEVSDIDIIDYTGYDHLAWKLPFNWNKQTSLGSDFNKLVIDTNEVALLNANGKVYTISRNLTEMKTFYLIATFTVGSMTAANRKKAWKALKHYLYQPLKVKKPIVFDSTDEKYKIYSVPVKLFKEYTIAIDSEQPVEFCCDIYNKYQDTRKKFNDLKADTYFRVNNMQFNQPILYSKLAHLNKSTLFYNEILTNEDDLRLFIKLPKENNSSIVILEGNYLHWNDVIKQGDNLVRNHTITNFESYETLSNLKAITPLQLLSANTCKQHPFADRLIEYLSGNVITPLDDIGDNVVRIQKILESPIAKKTDINNEIFNPNELGLWDEQIRAALYTFANNNQQFINKNYTDLLGYCDKDVEANYTANVKQIDKTFKETSISNIDIYTEIYNNIYDED